MKRRQLPFNQNLSPAEPTPLNHFNKALFFNALFIERISFNFGFDLSLIKSSPHHNELYNFGAVSG